MPGRWILRNLEKAENPHCILSGDGVGYLGPQGFSSDVTLTHIQVQLSSSLGWCPVSSSCVPVKSRDEGSWLITCSHSAGGLCLLVCTLNAHVGRGAFLWLGPVHTHKVLSSRERTTLWGERWLNGCNADFKRGHSHPWNTVFFNQYSWSQSQSWGAGVGIWEKAQTFCCITVTSYSPSWACSRFKNNLFVGWIASLIQHIQTQSGITNWNSILRKLNCKGSPLTE